MSKNTDSKGNITASREATFAFRDTLEAEYHTNWLYTTPNIYKQHKADGAARLRSEVAKHRYLRPPP